MRRQSPLGACHPMSEICYYISDMAREEDLTLKVLNRAKTVGSGSALTPRAFADLGNRAAVDRSTKPIGEKLERSGESLGGVYDIPKNHPTLGAALAGPRCRGEGYRRSVRLPPATDPGTSSEHARPFLASSRADRIFNRRQLPEDQSRKPDHPVRSTLGRGLCWEQVLPRVLPCRRSVRSGLTISRIP